MWKIDNKNEIESSFQLEMGNNLNMNEVDKIVTKF
jgi:hypothetical protein